LNQRRGSAENDDAEFYQEKGLGRLRLASKHVRYLINEGYDLKSATRFSGNHFLLSERQRLAIMRSLCTDEQQKRRKANELAPGSLAGRNVFIDGFNTIITLEIAACGSLLLESRDGCIRDLAGLRGTYRMIPETAAAVDYIFSRLTELGAAGISFYLDEPVSNSGRLKSLIAQTGERYHVFLDIQVISDVDRTLMAAENVITTDSVILDHCRSWFNLNRLYVQENNVRTVNVCEGEK